MSQPNDPAGQPNGGLEDDWRERGESERQRRIEALHMLALDSPRSQRSNASVREDPPSDSASSVQRVAYARARSLRAGRPTRRSRLWPLAIVPLVSVLAVAVFVVRPALHSGAPARSQSRTVLLSDSNRLYVDPDVPWTTMQVDGHRVSAGEPGSQPPLLLASGRHIISWQAAPFPAQQCVLSVPVAPDDTCPAAFEGIARIPGEPAAQILRLGDDSGNLLPANYASLEASIQAALNTVVDSSPVYAGEPIYLGGPGVNDGTYTATTQVQLDTLGSRPICQLDLHSATLNCSLMPNQCFPICSLDYSERQSVGSRLPPDQWLAIVGVQMWRDYKSNAGEPAYPDQTLSSGEDAFYDEALLIGARWQDGSWRVQLYIGTHLLTPSVADPTQRILVDPACSAAASYFAEYLSSSERTQYAEVRFVSGPNISAGCLIQATMAGGGGQVEYFERFGVLLALSSEAHLLNPSMLLADASVRQLASELASSGTAAIPLQYPVNDSP